MLITVWALNTHSLKYLDDKGSHPDPIPFVPDAGPHLTSASSGCQQYSHLAFSVAAILATVFEQVAREPEGGRP